MFNLIEGEYVDVESIYSDFKDDYLFTDVLNKDLRLQYGLSHKDFWDLARKVKKECGLNKRPRTEGKYYYPVKSGFIIQKRYGLKNVYLGFVLSEEVAIKMVELCKNHNWNVDVCRDIIRNWREYYV